jgi:hypothetical protein
VLLFVRPSHSSFLFLSSLHHSSQQACRSFYTLRQTKRHQVSQLVMPRTEPTLDCPPVELPAHKPEPLRRSHSSASVHSLPTPPPTRKRKRSRSTHSRATDSDSDVDEFDVGSDSDGEGLLRRKGDANSASLLIGSKKRKLLQVDVIAAELSGQAAEDAFWMSSDNTLLGSDDTLLGKDCSARRDGKTKTDAKGDGASSSRVRSESPERSPSASPPSRLLKKNRTGLLSPPQSRRRTSPRSKRATKPQPALAVVEEELAPVTPPRKPRPTRRLPAPKKALPERDSPNNPFLDTPIGSQGSDTPTAGSSAENVARHLPKRHIEKPTITYVLYVCFVSCQPLSHLSSLQPRCAHGVRQSSI